MRELVAGMNAQAVDQAQRRRRVRRTAIVLGLIALGFYGGFIAMSVLKALK